VKVWGDFSLVGDVATLENPYRGSIGLKHKHSNLAAIRPRWAAFARQRREWNAHRNIDVLTGTLPGHWYSRYSTLSGRHEVSKSAGAALLVAYPELRVLVQADSGRRRQPCRESSAARSHGMGARCGPSVSGRPDPLGYKGARGYPALHSIRHPNLKMKAPRDFALLFCEPAQRARFTSPRLGSRSRLRILLRSCRGTISLSSHRAIRHKLSARRVRALSTFCGCPE